MSSVVAEILNSAGVLGKDDMGTKVVSLKEKIEDTKLEVREILKNYYIDFIPRYVNLDKVVGALSTADSEYEKLHYHIEKELKPQLSDSVVEYQEMSQDLKQIKTLKKGVFDVINLHKNLDTVKLCIEQNYFVKAADVALSFEKHFRELGFESLKDVELLGALQNQFFLYRNGLVHTLMEFWHSKLSIVPVEDSQNCTYHTKLVLDTEQADKLSDVILALETLGELDGMLKIFGKDFMNMICTPIIMEEVQLERKDAKKGVITLTSNGRKTCQTQPMIILELFIYLFTFMNDTVFSWSCDRNDSRNDKKINNLMMKLGHLIHGDFCELLIEKCLKPAVPSESAELQGFQKVVNVVMNLDNVFTEIGFTSEDKKLKDFISNVDQFPADKMSLELLSRSRNLMKQGLHNTIHVGIEEISSQQGDNRDLDNVAPSRGNLSKTSFAFPSCLISEFAKNLVQLLEQVIREAEDLQAKSLAHSVKLIYTARKICELYCSVVPTYYKDEISSLPQQTAIHYNNCMFIAHRLLTLGAGSNIAVPVTFADLVQVLRTIGADAFLTQMRTQRQHILQLLKDPQAFQSSTPDVFNRVEKTVQQCLQQLELLRRVWSEVLPTDVYFKAIGTLLNTFLEEIICHVVQMEDIAAQTAAELDSVFSIVLKQSPQLFQVDKRGDKRDNIHTYVRRWFKFQELQLVLAASLREIVDRWTNGKGPLATHFSSDEVKHLIRALFQNTDRRATALSKIR